MELGAFHVLELDSFYYFSLKDLEADTAAAEDSAAGPQAVPWVAGFPDAQAPAPHWIPSSVLS